MIREYHKRFPDAKGRPHKDKWCEPYKTAQQLTALRKEPAAGPVVGILNGRARGMDLPVMLPTMQRTMNVPTEMDRPMMRRVSLT